jgi:Ca2+-binding RTX toxin-like protein
MQIDPLEPRRLLSFTLTNGTLNVSGTAGDDFINVSVNPIDGSIELDDNLDFHDFSPSDVKGIFIDAGAGDDDISIDPGISIPSTLFGDDGNDSIQGGGGNDAIDGFGGDDTLDGGAGDDVLVGGDGADELLGGAGTDTAAYFDKTQPVSLTLDGLANDGTAGEGDFIGSDIENLTGGDGNDTIIGDNAVNILDGGPGDDYLNGGGGDDALNATGEGNDTLVGGKGNDTAIYTSGGVKVTLDGKANDGAPGEHDNIKTEWVAVNGDNNMLVGDDGPNLLFCFGKHNTIIGNGGDDMITDNSPDGKCVVSGGPGDDIFALNVASASAGTVDGGPGTDAFEAFFTNGGSGVNVIDLSKFTGVENVSGTPGNDSIIGDAADNLLIGHEGNDTIVGMGGNDVIDGGLGADSLEGSAGDDVFVNNSNTTSGDADTVIGGKGFDIAQADPQDQLGVEFLYDNIPAGKKAMALSAQSLSSMQSLVTQSTQVLAAQAHVIPPGGVLEGGVLNIQGQLKKNGQAVSDSISVIYDKKHKRIGVSQNGVGVTYPRGSITGIVIDCGAGNDVVMLQRSDGTRACPISATILGGKGNDLIVGGSGNDSIAGGDGNDSIYGAAGNDILNGGGNATTSSSDGADYISGGAGLGDSVIYTQRTDDITVDISDGKHATDGAKGEGDSVQADVENVFTGNGNDLIIGNAASNLLSGSGGSDTIEGGDGNDKLIGGRDRDKLLGDSGDNYYAMADLGRDDADFALDKFGTPINAFVSGDTIATVKLKNVDFSLTSGRRLGVALS